MHDELPLTVEEGLHRIQEWAAMLRYMSDAVAVNSALPDSDVMGGVGHVCEEIQTMALRIESALAIDATSTPLTRKRRRE